MRLSLEMLSELYQHLIGWVISLTYCKLQDARSRRAHNLNEEAQVTFLQQKTRMAPKIISDTTVSKPIARKRFNGK